VQVLAHQAQRLDLALPQQQVFDGLEGAPTALRGIEGLPLGVLDRHLQQCQQGRQRGLQGPVEGQQLARDLLAPAAGVVLGVDLEVALEQIKDGQVGGSLAIGHRMAGQQQPAVGVVRPGELVQQARLAHARIPHAGHHLPLPRPGAGQGLAQLLQLCIAPHKARQATRHRRLQPRAHRPGAQQLVDLDGLRQPLHRHRSQRLDLDVALDQAQRVGGQQGGAGTGELFHARRQMCRLPHRRVVHVQIVADRAHHHRAAVQADADLHVEPLLPPQRLGIPPDGLLHGQGSIARPHRVVLVRQRGPEQRHDAVPQDLVDRALVAVHGSHQAFQDGIEELPGLLRITIGQEFHGAFEVGKEHRDLLALAFQGTAGGEDFLGEIGRRVGARGTLGRGSRRGRARGVPGPHEHFPVLVGRHALGIDELGLQVFEGIFIESELAFERAIGHAASTLKHGQRLVHNLLEGHGRSSNPLARVSRQRNVRGGGMSMGRASRVYQESGGVAGEIAPLGRAPHLGVISKPLEHFSNKEMAARPASPERTTP
jgi:hypothetical protein